MGGLFIHSTSSISSMQFFYCYGTTQRYVMLLFISSSSLGIFFFHLGHGCCFIYSVCIVSSLGGYQKIEMPRPKSPINKNEIRITTQRMIRSYITLATSLLQVPTSQKFVFSSICCMFSCSLCFVLHLMN